MPGGRKQLLQGLLWSKGPFFSGCDFVVRSWVTGLVAYLGGFCSKFKVKGLGLGAHARLTSKGMRGEGTR